MSLRILSRDFAFYGLLDFLQRSLSVLLVPIYTRVLTQTSYGNLDLILTVATALTVLADLQFVTGFARLYLERKRSGEGPEFVGTTILTRVMSGSVLALLFLSLGFSGHLEFSFMPSFLRDRTAWTIAVLTLPVTFAFDILLVQAQMLRRKKWFFTGAFGNTLLLTTLSVVLTVLIPLGIVGVLLSQLIGKVLATTALLAGLRRDVSFRYHWQLLREIGSYSLPLVPGRWVGHISAYISRFFIYAALGASENAILAVTTKMAAVVGVFCVAFRTAWQPLAMAYIGDENGERFYVRSLQLLIAGGVLTVFVLTAFSKPILSLLAPSSYGVAEYYIPLFLIAVILAELEFNLQLGNQISRKTYWISVSAVVEFTLNVLMLIALVSRMGIYGAGIAALVAGVARVAVTYFTAQHNHRVDYDKRSFLVFAIACISLLMLSLVRSNGSLSEISFLSIAILLGAWFAWIALATTERQIVRTQMVRLFSRILNDRSSQY